mmetsp:Transcript_13818/g.48804  ORF Transcript_13818/g.48804 Transcript_13818/m.48804 type:complete len:385 (+) Transcript_13818:56-1210(+)
MSICRLALAAIAAFFEICHGLHVPSSTTRSSNHSVGFSSTWDGPIPVDFYVFMGREPNGRKLVAPRASVNIGGVDEAEGFYTLCKDSCPTGIVQHVGYTTSYMRICPCIALLLVADLMSDFRVLLEASQDTPLFSMGQYLEVDAGQELFDIQKGHGTLRDLMDTGPEKAYYRKPGHLTVWIANDIGAENPRLSLAGTTFLDQPLYDGTPGAGVLLDASVSRRGRRLSHEVGHVVGFHHVAGGDVSYVYSHYQCPKEHRMFRWKTMSSPNCEMNIMGSWYDGPYCCPSASLLQVGSSQRATCLENTASAPKQPFCCGSQCSYNCPKEEPPMTFATSEHKDMLSSIVQCWVFLRGHAPLPGVSTMEVQRTKRVECVDFKTALGSCM